MKMEDVYGKLPRGIKDMYSISPVFASMLDRNCRKSETYEELLESVLFDMVKYAKDVTESHINNVMNSSCSPMFVIDNKKLEALDGR